MLTIDVIHALLLGLPAKQLRHLERSAWAALAHRIEHKLRFEPDPLLALKAALDNAGDSNRSELFKALAFVLPVMVIPRLSYRQREALIALRYLKSASLTHLSHTLMADRSNTNRRMLALVRRGLAIKFAQPGGTYFMAIDRPDSRELKRGIRKLLNDLMQEYSHSQANGVAPT